MNLVFQLQLILSYKSPADRMVVTGTDTYSYPGGPTVANISCVVVGGQEGGRCAPGNVAGSVVLSTNGGARILIMGARFGVIPVVLIGANICSDINAETGVQS